jgi:hypothetical protein
VRFEPYETKDASGAWKRAERGVPSTGEVIRRNP